MQLIIPADVTGDGAAHKLSDITGLTRAKWVQLVAIAGNAGVVRVGGSSIGADLGTPMIAGSGYMLPPIQDLTSAYDLTAIYVLLGVGDKVSVCCAT